MKTTKAKLVAQRRKAKRRKALKKIAHDFYTSDEWRAIRYKVLAKHGATCHCCGRSPTKHGIVVHVDHIKPKSRYPHLALKLSNLQILCEDCNLGKMASDTKDWRPENSKNVVLLRKVDNG